MLCVYFKFLWSNVSFKATLSYWLCGWSFYCYKWSVQVPYYQCVIVTFSPMSVNIFFIYSGASMISAQIFTIVSSCLSLYYYSLPLYIAIVFFLVYYVWYKYSYTGFSPLLLFAWNIFIYSLTFSLYVSLGLKWVSCKQPIGGSFFFFLKSIQSVYFDWNIQSI